MIKKRTLLAFTIIPFIIGYFFAQSRENTVINTPLQPDFYNSNIQPNDKITLASGGNIYSLTENGVNQVTKNQNIIEPVPLGNNYVAIDKETNFSKMIEFDGKGNVINTLFNGDTGNIDTMNWATDPAVNNGQNKIAFVSDKDRLLIGAPDNALYVYDLSSAKSTNIAKPDPYSGGLAHPVWDPADSNILFYDYYQYDPKTLEPYSTVMEYDKQTGEIFPLTTDKQNAFQSSISSDGKKVLFIIRNNNAFNVSLYIADFGNNGLSNEHLLATGDFAYPQFSNSDGYIYYLMATGNTGYNLMKAQIVNNKLSGIVQITSGSNLLGNSSFTVSKQ